MSGPVDKPPDHRAALLAAARAGDEGAFDQLVRPHRTELHAHCYRMLGSVHDAEDVLQEVLFRAWRGLGRFEGRSSLRGWLYRIATNASLNALEARSRRVLPVDLGPAPSGEPARGAAAPVAESVWLEPYPETDLPVADPAGGPAARFEQRESLELAFVAALQYLPANQRAALILRDVLGFSARDAAEVLETSTTSVNSALQHARTSVEQRIPARSQQATLRALGDERLRRLVERYMTALENADIDELVSLLAEDATWSMPPATEWYQGHPAIREFLVGGPFRARWRHVPTRANGQLAVGCYIWDEAKGAYVAWVLDVLTLEGDRIGAVTAFIDPSLFAGFGLPEELPA